MIRFNITFTSDMEEISEIKQLNVKRNSLPYLNYYKYQAIENMIESIEQKRSPK